MTPSPEQTVEILAAGALDQVQVHWDPRPCLLDTAIQAHIDERWAIYLHDAQTHGRMLFNGPITRLIDYHVDGTTLRLTLGPSDYKTFLVTALRDHAWFAQHSPYAICAALGNSSLLSYGSQCVLGVRSHNVSAYAGRAHVFGGVVDGMGTSDYPASAVGLLAHLRCELHEEMGLAAADFAGPPRLLGLTRDPLLHQPELMWHWELQSPIATILHRLNQDEHSDYLILDRGIAQAAMDSRLTPSAIFAFQTWSKLPVNL